MKKGFLILVLLGLSVCVYAITFAQTPTPYVAKVNMPVASGIAFISTSKIDSNFSKDPDDHDWIPGDAGKNLDMGALGPVTGTTGGKTWVVWLPRYYYAIDIGLNGGVDPDATIEVKMDGHSEPTGFVPRTSLTVLADNGLGTRGNVTYVTTVLLDYDANTTEDTLIGTQKYRCDEDVSIDMGDTVGGWLRMYVGVANGDPDAVPPDAPNSLMFSTSDVTGDYTVGLQITYIS